MPLLIKPRFSNNLIEKETYFGIRLKCRIHLNKKEKNLEAIVLNKKFHGPFSSFDKIKNRAGIYLVVCEAFGMTPVRVLDAGDSENVKEKLRGEEKRLQLKNGSSNSLKYLVHYEQNTDARAKLNKEIKKQLYPVM